MDILKKHKDKKEYLCEIDGFKIIARDINEKNNTVYVVEDSSGSRSIKLYNEINQDMLPRNNFKKVDIKISKKTDKGLESTYIKNYSSDGTPVPIEIELECDKFLHPEKYEK